MNSGGTAGGMMFTDVTEDSVYSNIGDGVFHKHPEFIKPRADQTALGPIGLPQDVAKVIVNLLSDDCGWDRAQDIDVSGGLL